MSRKYEYINISTPKVRAKPGRSHDLQLVRDLEIVNARTVAELGSLPSGGLPVVPKHKCIPLQTAAMSMQVMEPSAQSTCFMDQTALCANELEREYGAASK